MILKYVNKIRAKISIFSSKKTKNLLDGTYQSVYKVIGNYKGINEVQSAAATTSLTKPKEPETPEPETPEEPKTP